MMKALVVPRINASRYLNRAHRAVKHGIGADKRLRSCLQGRDDIGISHALTLNQILEEEIQIAIEVLDVAWGDK